MYQYISANHITKDLTTLRYKSLDDFVAEKSKMFNTFEELEEYILTPKLVVQPTTELETVDSNGAEDVDIEDQDIPSTEEIDVEEVEAEEEDKPEEPVFEVKDADEDFLYALITKGSVEGVGFQKQLQKISVSGSAVSVSLGSDGIPQEVQEVERIEPEVPEEQNSQITEDISANLDGGEIDE